MATLSVCPFCKSSDVDILYGWQCYYAKCDDCGSEGSACVSQKAAIDAWNTSKTKQPMKDHEFREEVNALKKLVLNYANTEQLRSRLADFLQVFKEKCQ